MAERWIRLRHFVGRHRWPFAAVALIVLGSVVWMVVLATRSPAPPLPRARQYLEFTACLLTDERGITGPEAKPVWAGMQDASLATRAKVQYLAVAGTQTVDNAVPYLNTLAQRRCDLVLAAGAVPTGAVGKAAAQFPRTRFVVVGPGTTAANVVVVTTTAPETVRPAVSKIVTDAVGPKR
jgi:basic membrane lipoprotein Med (substrate-binding protein (PBP1-ABC) superfamily)